METIELRFLGGRFHATPWGRNVNEGVPEWPPSPFRIVRALFDTWRRKHPELSQERIGRLFQKLASEAPSFELPPACASHLRLFLRQDSPSETDKKLVFDPFVVVMPDAWLRVHWPTLSLDAEQREDLRLLLGSLSYLGRSESLVEARTTGVHPPSFNAVPATQGMRGGEVVRVACLTPPEAPLPDILPKRGRRAAAPLTWFDALGWGSAETLKLKLTDPPALTWVDYRVAVDALSAAPVRRRAPSRTVHQLLLGLDGKVLPLATESVTFAEQFRRRAMGAHKRIAGGPSLVSPLLTGKDDEGRPLTRDHAHAFFLPLDVDGDGRLDHLLIRSREGLDESLQRALLQVPAVSLSKGRPDVRLVGVWRGGEADALESGRVFSSLTPFVTERHFKERRWRDKGGYDAWLEDEVSRALAQHFGVAAPSILRIQPLPWRQLDDGRRVRWLEYRRSRSGDVPLPGFGFRIEFDREVTGPFALGYGAHFGLGLFTIDRTGFSARSA